MPHFISPLANDTDVLNASTGSDVETNAQCSVTVTAPSTTGGIPYVGSEVR